MQVSSLSASSIGATALAIKSKVDDQTLVAASEAGEGPVVRVTLSDAAKAALAGAEAPVSTQATSVATATKAMNSLLASSGEAIYGAAISSLKTYPTDLSTRYDALASRKTLTPDETAEALKLNQDRNAREEQAFFQYARQANAAATPQERSRLMAQFNKAYTEYYDGLSPVEQASPRYAGTRPGAAADYASWIQEAGETPDDLSGSGDPILMLFDKIREQSFNVDDEGAKSVLQDYKDGVANLVSSQTDPENNAALVAQASSNFSAVQSVVDQARSGDADAFVQLQRLANDPSSLTNFLAYAEALAKA